MNDTFLYKTFIAGGVLMTFLAGYGFAYSPYFFIPSSILLMCGIGALAVSVKALFVQVVQQIKTIDSFRENIKSHCLKHGIVDERLYGIVLDETRKMLPSNHPAVRAHEEKGG